MDEAFFRGEVKEISVENSKMTLECLLEGGEDPKKMEFDAKRLQTFQKGSRNDVIIAEITLCCYSAKELAFRKINI